MTSLAWVTGTRLPSSSTRRAGVVVDQLEHPHHASLVHDGPEALAPDAEDQALGPGVASAGLDTP